MSTALTGPHGPNLFDIEQSLAMLMNDRDEVTDPAEVEAVEAAIREYITLEIRKVDGIRAYVRCAETMAAAAKEEAARATAIAEAWQRRASRIKEYSLAVMTQNGIKRLDGKAGYLIVKGNGGLAPLRVQDDVLPDEYRDITLTIPLSIVRELPDGVRMSMRTKSIEPANGRIREALKIGPVPGASLEERGVHIEVK